MKRIAAIIIALLAVIYGGWAVAYNLNPESYERKLDTSEILKLVNDERKKTGVQPLIPLDSLATSAQIKADDLAKNNYIEHKDSNGKQGYEYAQEATGNMCVNVGENLQESLTDEKGVVESWKSSKGHYEAMLRADYTHTGIAYSGNKIVQHFCAT